MSTKTRILLFTGLVAATAGVIFYGVFDKKQDLLNAGTQKEAATKAAEEALRVQKQLKIQAAITVDVEPFFADAKVKAALERAGIVLSPVRMGSRDMADALEKQSSKPTTNAAAYTVFIASGVVAGSQIADVAKAKGISPVVSSPFFTPLVFATWAPVIERLKGSRIASADAEGIVKINTAALLKVMNDKKRWSELPGTGFSSPRSVLVSTTDPLKSNSAATYLAMMAAVSNGGEAPQTLAEGERLASALAHLFLRQGYKESYVNGAFEDYIGIGMGKSPIAFVYESQMLTFAAQNNGIQKEMALAYPDPGIFSKIICIEVQPETKRLCDTLASDADMQEAATRYGFRSGPPEPFALKAKALGLSIPARINNLVDPPAHSVMISMINTIKKLGEQ
jgi:hypothetical protein